MGLTLYRPRHYFWHFLGLLLLLLPCRLELLQEGRKKPGTCLQLAARPGQLGSGGSSLQFLSSLAPLTPPTSSPNHTPRLLPLHLLLRNTIQRSSVLLYTHTIPCCTHSKRVSRINPIQKLVKKCSRRPSVADSTLCGT